MMCIVRVILFNCLEHDL